MTKKVSHPVVPLQTIEDRRNHAKFPEDFMFPLTFQEKTEVVAKCDLLRDLKFSHVLPYAFTEYGALQAANVLNSPRPRP